MKLHSHNNNTTPIFLAAVSSIIFCICLLFLLILTYDPVQDFFIGGGFLVVAAFSNLVNSAKLFVFQGVTVTISTLGYPGIFLLMFLESTSLPIPSEVILPFSGYLVSVGRLDLWVVILLSTAAGIAGSLVDYYLGRLVTASVWRNQRVLRRLHLAEGGGRDSLERAERWFNRYSAKAVLFTRMILGMRTLISFPAGAAKMSMREFLAYSAVGCFLWNALLTILGLYLGSHWSELQGITHYSEIGIIVVLGSVAIWWWFRIKARRIGWWRTIVGDTTPPAVSL